MPDKSLISVILSFRNEEDVLEELIRRLQATLSTLPYSHELIFVNDDSTDRSLSILKKESTQNPSIKIVNMSRRFGVSECVLAGMEFASGDAVIYMDADLQDPPELIPTLLEKWQQGVDVVHTVRTKREGESAVKLRLTDVAYSFISSHADIPLLSEAGDFKLLSRRAVNELRLLPEKTPYLRGLVSWIGFRQASIPYTRQARAGGKTKFPLFRNFFQDFSNMRGPIGTLVIGLTSFSIFPIVTLLACATLIGLLSLIALLCMAIFSFTQGGISPYFWILGTVSLFSALQLFGIGLLGVYLGRVYQDVRGRPRYIIESTIGFEQKRTR